MNSNSGSPCFPKLTPIHTFVAARLCKGLALVHKVLTVRAWPNVFSFVVQTVTIPVVILWGVDNPSTFSNCSVHPNIVVPHSIVSLGIPEVSPGNPELGGVPLPLHEPFVINGVNDGEFTLCERDEAGISVHVGSLAGRFGLATNQLASFHWSALHPALQAKW